MSSTDPQAEAAALAALASLPEVGPARLSALLRRGTPVEVLAALRTAEVDADAELAAACRRGDPTGLLRTWGAAARAVDEAALWADHQLAGVEVLHPSCGAWPQVLLDDPEPPAVLFARGDVGVLGRRPAVAVVGTRRCTRYGWDIAHDLGAGLAAAGVHVVSGLADGIDAAAHRGALDAGGAPPVGVVATGLDVAYPSANRGLWREVADAGALASEAPLGTRPARWRFPARNRVIAALADVVVVVESRTRGGAMHTVDEAVRRDRPVLAVPGPITSAASAGSNRLLADVALPLCDVDDVLVALGLAATGGAGIDDGADASIADDLDAIAILEALGWTEATLDAVAVGAGLGLGATAAALARLEGKGLVADAGGRWQRVAPSPGVAR